MFWPRPQAHIPHPRKPPQAPNQLSIQGIAGHQEPKRLPNAKFPPTLGSTDHGIPCTPMTRVITWAYIASPGQRQPGGIPEGVLCRQGTVDPHPMRVNQSMAGSKNSRQREWENPIKIAGGLLVTFGLLDLIGSFVGLDVWGEWIGLDLPGVIWACTAYIK